MWENSLFHQRGAKQSRKLMIQHVESDWRIDRGRDLLVFSFIHVQEPAGIKAERCFRAWFYCVQSPHIHPRGSSSIMSSQHRSPWHVDVFRTLTRFNLPKQLPRRPSVPKTWTFLPRQWPPNIPGLNINVNILQQPSHRRSSPPVDEELPRRFSQPSRSSYDSCMSTVLDPGRPSFDQLANYGTQAHDWDSSSCSSSSYSELLWLFVT